MEHRVLSAPGKHSTIEPHSQALMGAGVGWALDRDRDLTIEPHCPVLILFLGHSGTGKTTETEDMFMTNWGWDRKKANKTVSDTSRGVMELFYVDFIVFDYVYIMCMCV